MHELWLCKNILDIIRQRAAGKNFVRIKKVILEIGQLTAIEQNSLYFSFDVVTKGSMAENAELSIIYIPGKALCESCQHRFPLRQYYDECPTCGSHSLIILQGEELRIKSMVVE